MTKHFTILMVALFVVFVVMPTVQLRADGDVEIELNDDGDLRVRGENNTTQCILVEETGEGEFTFSNLANDLAGITLFNGEETLIVNGIFGDVRFDLKSGFKVLVLCNAGGDDFDIFGNLRISNSGSDPAIIITDDIDVDGTTDIKTKNGNDAVLMLDSDFRQGVNINSGGGNDVVGTETASDFFDELQIQMGSGNDVGLFLGTQFRIETDFRLGGGNDAIGFDDCEFVADNVAEINGNGGFDDLADQGTFFDVLILKSIEADNVIDFLDIADLASDNDTFNQAIDIIIDLGLG